MPPALTLDIQHPRHWAALQSIPRMAVLGRLLSQGPQTISELAEGSGRTHQSMAYHVRVLEDAGLVEDTGDVRQTGKRPAAVFRAAGGAEKARVYVDPDSELAMHRLRANMLAVAKFTNQAFIDNVEAAVKHGRTCGGPLLNCALVCVPPAVASRVEREMRSLSSAIDEARQATVSAEQGGTRMLFGLWMAEDLVGRGPVADFELTHTRPPTSRA